MGDRCSDRDGPARRGDRHSRDPRDGDRYSPPQRGGGRFRDSRDRGWHSPQRGGGRDDRGRGQPQHDRPSRDYDNKIPQGGHKITISNIPDDMSWHELKDLGREYGPSLTFARTYQGEGGRFYGMIEFRERVDAENAINELDNRRVQGATGKLRAEYGDLSERREPPRRDAGYSRDFHGGRDDRDRYDSYRGTPRGRSRSPARRGKDDEDMMTLFVRFLPDDIKQDEISSDLGSVCKVARVVLMRKGEGGPSAFVRFETVRDAELVLDQIRDERVKVGGAYVKAEMARTNTTL